jgi:hypothetical protein
MQITCTAISLNKIYNEKPWNKFVDTEVYVFIQSNYFFVQWTTFEKTELILSSSKQFLLFLTSIYKTFTHWQILTRVGL